MLWHHLLCNIIEGNNPYLLHQPLRLGNIGFNLLYDIAGIEDFIALLALVAGNVANDQQAKAAYLVTAASIMSLLFRYSSMKDSRWKSRISAAVIPSKPLRGLRSSFSLMVCSHIHAATATTRIGFVL